MAKKIAVLNFKGGVGKTTTSINLCAALAQMKKKVLLVDLDQQCNTTKHLGYNIGDGETIFEALVNEDDPELPIYDFEGHKNFWFVPSSALLREASERLVARMRKEEILHDLVTTIEEHFDYIIYDCPPGDGMLNMNAVCASDGIIIPLLADDYSLDGVSELVARINKIKNKMRLPDLQIYGFLFTVWRGRLTKSKSSLSEMKDAFPGMVFNTRIRTCASFTNTPSEHKTIFDYAPKSAGAEDYMQFAKELIKSCNS